MIKKPFNLRCEYLTNPICIDVKKPRFSWLLEHERRNQKQMAYQIIVSSNLEFAKKNEGDIWNSGKIVSNQNSNVIYEGKPLESDTTYYWRVKWWDKNKNESEFSNTHYFGTALFYDHNWKAKWISKEEFVDKRSRKKLQYVEKIKQPNDIYRIKELYALYLRKEFSILKQIKSAKLYICGIGYYHLQINGNKIGDRILDPAQTDYNKLALYSTYDVTDILQKNNAVGVILGNGRCIELYGYDFPKLIMQINIHYKNGNSEIICSDNTWKVSNGPIRKNGIYFGEVYDARLEMPGWDKSGFNDTDWKNAVEINGYKLASQMMEPIQISKIISPKNIYSPEPGVYVIDFKQNFTGFVRMNVNGPRGTKVKLRFAEIINKEGQINTATNGGAPANDIYILKGEGEEYYEPHFTYHGFRYVEITGFPGVPTLKNFEGLFFHSNVPKVGDFYCSNALINQIHSNILWGQLSNLMSIPTDCPQRDERHGWMGDAQLITEEAILNYGMARFFSKYLRDIKECQKEDGSISDVVPPYWIRYPADPAWGSAYITIAWYLYWYYNDLRVLRENYEGMKNYINFLISISENDLISMGKYGDWCPPCSIVSRKTRIEVVSSWYFYHDTYYFSKIAEILGKTEDLEHYKNKAKSIKNAFNENFLKYKYGTIKWSPADRTVSQTSNVLPLYLNIVPEKKKNKVLSTLIRTIKNDYDYHLDTGMIGTRFIFEVLTHYGYPEIAYKMITQTSFPGYGYMIKEGATTLWERWEKLEGGGMNSHNHIMLGSVDTWFYKTLVGIKCLSSGWNHFQIKPFIPDEIDYSCASLKTVKGLIYCAWEKINSNFNLTISIPVGCEVEVWIPLLNGANAIKEGNTTLLENMNPLGDNDEIIFKELDEEYVIFNIYSGYYQFTAYNSELVEK